MKRNIIEVNKRVEELNMKANRNFYYIVPIKGGITSGDYNKEQGLYLTTVEATP